MKGEEWRNKEGVRKGTRKEASEEGRMGSEEGR
jgi:hypothetical protein